jgi:hypothetical protein
MASACVDVWGATSGESFYRVGGDACPREDIAALRGIRTVGGGPSAFSKGALASAGDLYLSKAEKPVVAKINS